MLDVKAIRQAIADRLTDQIGCKAFAFDVDNDVYPRAVVLADNPFITYHATFSAAGISTLQFLVEVTTRAADAVAAQAALAEYCSSGTGATRSVIDALEYPDADDGTGGPTLSGAVLNVVVNDVFLNEGVQTQSGIEFKATFRVGVKASRGDTP